MIRVTNTSSVPVKMLCHRGHGVRMRTTDTASTGTSDSLSHCQSSNEKMTRRRMTADIAALVLFSRAMMTPCTDYCTKAVKKTAFG